MGGGVEEVEFEVPWLPDLAQVRPGAVTVSSLLPPGFDRYLRVFHPFVPWDAEYGPVPETCSWQSLAQQARVPFGPTLTRRQLEGVLPLSEDRMRRPWAVWEGELEQRCLDSLLSALVMRPAGRYRFGSELSAIVGTGQGALCFEGNDVRCWRAAVEMAHARGVRMGSPEHIWPLDLEWIVHTDYDLTSTYVAAGEAAARRVLANDRLEVLEVDLQTRVDDSADETNSEATRGG